MPFIVEPNYQGKPSLWRRGDSLVMKLPPLKLDRAEPKLRLGEGRGSLVPSPEQCGHSKYKLSRRDCAEGRIKMDVSEIPIWPSCIKEREG